MIQKIAEAMKRHNNRLMHYAVALCLSLFSSFTLAGVFFKQNALYGDRYYFYSYFYDIIHSLYRFQEFPWWNPAAQDGLPHYYTALLGLNYGNPVAMLVAGAAYIAGQLHLPLISITRLYVLYLGVLVPLIYMAGVALCSRRLFRSNAAVTFVLVIAAFSPGMVTNLSDIGFEPAAFGLLFIASFLHWLDHPARRSALWAMLCAGLLALVCVNYLFLFWNLVFLPLFVAAWYLLSMRPAGKRFPAIPAGMMIFGLLAVLIVISPTLAAYVQGNDMVRRPMNTRVYEYYRIAAGNPIQFLSVSLPAVINKSCSFISYESALSSLASPYIYNYMGLLTLPLAIIGLIWGRKPLRQVLYVLLAVSMLVINLSAFSPIFSLLLMPKTPLQSVNHFSDLFYLTGACILTIFAAGLGIEALSRFRTTRIYKYMVAILACSIGLMTASMFFFYNRPMDVSAVGFFCSMALMLLVAVAWAARSRTRKRYGSVIALLIVLTLVDVSTSAFLFARTTIWPYLQKSGQMNLAEPPPDTVGFPSDDMRSWYANTFLGLKSTIMREATGMTTTGMPLAGIYEPRAVIHRAAGNDAQVAAPDGVIVMTLADVDGNGTTEVVGRTAQGRIVMRDASGKTVACGNVLPDSVISFGDCNGDHTADLIEYRVNGDVLAAFSDRKNFSAPVTVAHLHPFFNKLLGCADISASGKKKIFFLDIKDGSLVRLGLDGKTNHAGNINLELIHKAMFRKVFDEISFSDINGDGRDDMVLTLASAVYVGTSDGMSFSPLTPLSNVPAVRPTESLEYSIIQASDRITAIQSSYSRITMNTDLARPSTVVIRTASAPFWKVTGGTGNITVTEDLCGLLAVSVPAGPAAFELYYRPPWVPSLLILSYLLIVSVMALWLVSCAMEKKNVQESDRENI